MSFCCGNCGMISTYKLADGSCPDCYSIGAMLEVPVFEPAGSRFNRTLRAPGASGDLRGPRPQSKHVEQTAISARPTANRFSLGPSSASRFASASNSRFGNPAVLPVAEDARTVGGRRVAFREDVRSSKPAAPVPPAIRPPMSTEELFSSGFGDKAILDRLDGLNLGASTANHRLTPGPPDAVAQVFGLIGGRRADVFACIEACKDVAVLDGYANHIQNAMKIVDSFRIRVQERRKDLPGCRATPHGTVNGKGNAAKKDVDPDQIVSTIVVKKLPKTVERADLEAYFATFCKSRREVQNVVLPKDHQTREGKSFAYVTFARCEIVRAICSQEKHTMVAKMGTLAATEHRITVEPFNEVEQHKKKAKYEIFIKGTSSFMSELDFVRALELEHGKVREIYYCSNRGNPGLDNGYAMLTFENPEVTKKVLQAREVKVNGRALPCWPWEHSKKHAAKNNNDRDGRAGQERKKKGPKDVDEDLLCCVCVDKRKCIMFQPCNHMTACEECAKKLNSCPYCRQPAIEKVKVFL